MNLFVPSIINGCEEIIKKQYEIKKLKNDNYYLGFAKYNECIDFLKLINETDTKKILL